MTSAHSQRLENWLTSSYVAEVSTAMRGWYGPPIPLAGVPGRVFATGDGDFIGRCEVGGYATHSDLTRELWRYLTCRSNARSCLFSGFATLNALRSAKTRNTFPFVLAFQGAGSGSIGSATVEWYGAAGTSPAAGTNGAAAPAGRVPVGGTDGGWPFRNPPSGQTTHLVGGVCGSNSATGYTAAVLLYDRLFDVAKSMSSTATEAVTGVPTRYQSATATDADYIGGNFCFPVAATTLGNTAHSWNVCTYLDQASAASTFPSIAGFAQCPPRQMDIALNNWFMPLEAGDVGVKALTQMQCSASVTSGTIDFVIGHPIAWFCQPSTFGAVMQDTGGVITGFNMARIFDNACLSLIRLVGGQAAGAGYFHTASS